MFSIICRLIPRHLENLLVHVLLQLLQCRASLGTTTVDFTLFTRSSTYCVCLKVVGIMSSAFVSLWVYELSWCASSTPHDRPLLDHRVPFALHSVLVLSVASCNITRPAHIVNLPFTTHQSHTRADELPARSKFTIVLSAERCQSTRRLNIGSVFLSEHSATA